MITANHAHLWGMKAARAGLPSTSNPYLNQQYRSAWEAGFHQGASGSNALERR